MRLARVVRYSFLGILALLAIVIVLLLTVDLGRLKGTTENILSDLLGRELTINGEFRLELGRHIRVVAEDVRLANADWGAVDDFASVGHLEGTIDAWSLFGSPILIESLRIENARVHLESTNSGASNWALFQPKEPHEAEDATGKDRPRLPVMVIDASVADFELTYNNPQRPHPFLLAIAELRVARTGTDELRLEVHGNINDTLLELTASAGTIDNLAHYRDIEFGVSGHLGEIRFDGEASVDDLLRPRRPTAQLQLRGPNAEYLTTILRLRQVTTGPLDLTATIEPVGENMQLLLNGVFGEFSLDVTGSFVDFQERRDIDIRVAASGPDAGALAGLFGNENVPEDPFSIVGNLQRSGNMIAVDEVKVTIGESQFNIGGRFEKFPDPRSARATIRVDGPDFGRFNKLLGLPGRLTGPFTLGGDLVPLAEGGATVDLTAAAHDVQVRIVGSVADNPDFVGSRVQVTVAGPNLQTVTTAGGLASAPAEPFELTLVAERVAKGAAIESGTLIIADDRLSLRGMVGNDPLQADTDVHFELSGPDIARTLTAFGRNADELATAQYKLSGRIERGTEFFLLHDVMAAIGDDLEYQLTANGRFSLEPGFAGSSVRFSATGASLGALADAAGIEGIPDFPFEVDGDVRYQGDHYAVQNLTASLAGASIRLNGRLGALPGLEGTKLTVQVNGADLSLLLPDEEKYSALNKSYELSTNFTLRDQQLSMSDIELLVGEARLTGEVDLGLSPLFGSGRFSLDASAPDLLQLAPKRAAVSVNEQAPLKLHSVGRWADSLWTVDKLNVQLGKGTMTASGTLDGPPNLDRTDLRFELNILSLRNLSALAGRDLPNDPAYLSFRLVGTDDTMAMDDFKGTFGDSDITGDFSLRYGDVPAVQIGFRSDRLNLAPYLPDATEEVEPQVEPNASAVKRDRVIPDVAIPVEALRKYVASVDVRVTEINLPHRSLNNFVLSGALEDGALLVKEFGFESAHGATLAGEFDMRAVDSGVELLLAVQGTGLRVGLPAQTEEEFSALPKYDFDTTMHGSGATVRELAGSLDGYVRLVIGQGRVKASAVAFLAGDILSQVVTTVNPFAKTDPYSNFECGAFLLRSDGGVITGRPGIVTQSDRLRVFANTDVDLNTEKIDVTFNTVPRKGLGISFGDLINPYTKLGGTLANPVLTLNPEGAMIEGGAAIATAGISILAKSVKDRFLSAKDPCGKALEDADPDFRAIKNVYYPESTTVQ
jgi:uncharacterized protein involved in outer membrane biogenesis